MTFSLFQKARLARIRIAKASSGAAFVTKKKAAEARIAAQESGLDMDEFNKEEEKSLKDVEKLLWHEKLIGKS